MSPRGIPLVAGRWEGVLDIWFLGDFWVGVLDTLYIDGLSGLWTHTQELLRMRKETRNVAGVELFNLVLDIVSHWVLTWMSLQIPGIWVLS